MLFLSIKSCLKDCRWFYTILKNYEFWLYSKKNERVKGKEFCLQESLQFTLCLFLLPAHLRQARKEASVILRVCVSQQHVPRLWCDVYAMLNLLYILIFTFQQVSRLITIILEDNIELIVKNQALESSKHISSESRLQHVLWCKLGQRLLNFLICKTGLKINLS